jgi:MFS family permease
VSVAPLRDPRSFWLLNGTQFLTVLNDNVFKQTVVLLAIAAQGSEGSGAALAQILFSLPFVLFALYAGDCADRWPKRDVVTVAKWAECGVMLLGAAALAWGGLTAGLAVLFLMALQSAFLGPAKYGALPEYAGRAALARANGWFQALMMAGIVLGTGAAGFALKHSDARRWLIPLGLAAIAAAGALVAARMARLPAAAPSLRPRFAPWRRLREGLREAAARRGLRALLYGHALFWCASSLAYVGWNELIAVQPDGTRLVVAEKEWWSLGLAALGLGLGAGAAACGLLARRWPLARMALFGATVMAAGFAAAGTVPPRPSLVLACGLVAAFGSGFFVVPLRTLIQELAPPARLGATLGVSQTLDFVGIALGGVARLVLRPLGCDAREVLVATALLLALGALALARGISAAGSEAARASAGTDPPTTR